MNFKFRRPFPSHFDIERLRERPDDGIPRVGDGGGPILHVRPDDGRDFLLVLPEMAGTPHAMTWPNPRKMLVQLDRYSWLVDIDHPALEEVDLPRGLSGLRPFAVPTCGIFVAFNGSRVIGFGEEGKRFQCEYDCNVTNVELQNDELIVTWWPNAQGKWIDRINLRSGARISRGVVQ